MDTAKFNYRQLTIAREYRGYSQSDLSQAIKGLSQSNLSKFEKGFGGLSEEIIDRIVGFLDFPRSFFKENISNVVDSAHFRKRASITKKKRLEYETNIKLIGFIIDKMSESIEWPDYTFSSFDVDDFSPEYIARFIRKKLKIEMGIPIDSINKILENNGVVVVELDVDSDKFDGVSFITDLGTPTIVINKNFSNDRKRFTLAHELGHIIMHILCEAPISKHRDKEDEANRFAAEFLMPKESIYNSLINLKISELGELKRYWLTSMASLIYRAKMLNAIDSERSKYLNIELSRRGWKTKEPIETNIDKPNSFETAFKMHREDLSYQKEDFINGFSLPYDIIQKFMNSLDNRNKLRIVI